jgi:hypothetical protein
MAARGTFGSFFALEKGTRRPGAKARIIKFLLPLLKILLYKK